jgi:hypothetical protein
MALAMSAARAVGSGVYVTVTERPLTVYASVTGDPPALCDAAFEAADAAAAAAACGDSVAASLVGCGGSAGVVADAAGRVIT